MLKQFYRFLVKNLFCLSVGAIAIFLVVLPVYAQSCCPDGTHCPSGQCVGGQCMGGCVANSGADPGFELPSYEDLGLNFKYGGLLGGAGIIGDIISDLLPYIFIFAGLSLFAYLLYGGFQLATSFGSPKAILEAWQIIFRALVGFVLVFASFWLTKIVETVFGLRIL